MTRIPFGNCMQAEAEKKITQKMRYWENTADLALEIIAREGLKCADRLDAEKRPRGYWETLVAPEGLYDGIAALRLLQQRYGENYALCAIGFRKPQTLLEKLKHFLTGNLPKLQSAGVKV